MLSDVVLPDQGPSSGVSWWLGTVTGVDPLRVRRDTETSAAGATPDSLVPGLVVGERVQMVTHFGRPLVVGRLKSQIQNGSHSTRGEWWRYPDGRQEVWLLRTFAPNANVIQNWEWVFPQPFQGLPHGVAFTPQSTVPDRYRPITHSTLSGSSVLVHYLRETNWAADVLLAAWGRWK